jgi:acyl-CoA hydrolase
MLSRQRRLRSWQYVGRPSVDAVVTEHGVAELRGVSEGERARRLIAIAAPAHRELMRDAAASLGF